MNFLPFCRKNTTFGLLTDFGFDFAVASMKALIFKSLPKATIIDIDHTIEKFSIISGAFILAKIYTFFPSNTIFITIVDPGVGTERDALVVQLDSYTFFGPNNGLLHYIVNNTQAKVFKIDDHILPEKSNTFHGRDLFTPLAIQYAQGPVTWLSPFDPAKIVRLPQLENQKVITYIDSFGNIKTNITVNEQINTTRQIHITVGNRPIIIPFVSTFGSVSPGTLLCYQGSNNTLEIAVSLGSAQHSLGVKVGDTIIVS